MFNTDAASKSDMFRSAMIVRSLLIGYRYWRQPAVHKARLMNAMCIALAKNNNPDAVVDFNINNVKQTLVRFAASMYDEADAVSWAEDVLFMAAPSMFKRAGETDEQAYARWNEMYLAACAGGFSDFAIVALAVAGNPQLSVMHNANGHNMDIYNEDECIGAEFEVPILPTNIITLWADCLHNRRHTQHS